MSGPEGVDALLKEAEEFLLLSRYREAEEASLEVLRRTVYIPGASNERRVCPCEMRLPGATLEAAQLHEFSQSALLRAAGMRCTLHARNTTA